MHLEVEPKEFVAEMNLEVTLDKPKKVPGLSYEKKLYDQAVPGAGVVIKEIVELGLQFQYAVGVTTKLKSGITYLVGAKATLPATSKLTLDAINLDNNAATGFEDSQIDPMVEIKSLSATAEIALAAKPKLIFGIDVLDRVKFEISAIINLPELKGSCAAKFSR